MAKYTVKRLLQSLVTILIVVTIVFLLLRMLPTDYFFTEDQLMKLTDQQKHDQLKAAGLLDSTFTQLTRYYGQLLRLDFGTSRRIQSGVSVVKVIGGKFAMSMQLGLISFAISLVIGVVMGVLQARFKDGIIDGIGTIYTILVNAVPPLVAYCIWFPCVRASFNVFNEKSRTVYDPAGCMSFSFINCRLCTVDKTLHGR